MERQEKDKRRNDEIELEAQGARTHSKDPSTYFTINEVFPICESPTIPTLRTTLFHARTANADMYVYGMGGGGWVMED